MALVIIFLEGKLFQSGTSVFGLFTVLSLCLATMQAYFWILVQVTYQVVSQGFSLRVLYCVADTGYGHWAWQISGGIADFHCRKVESTKLLKVKVSYDRRPIL